MAGTISLMVVGIILLLLAIKLLNNFKLISKEGIEVEGIVFGFEQSTSTGTGVSYPVVRFLTLQNQWVTQKSNIGTIPGLYKKGERINVVYQKNNPIKFYIKDKKTSMAPFIMITIASILIILGILKLIIFN